MAANHRRSFIDQCVKDAQGHIVLWQTPNAPLWIWIMARLLVWPLGGTLESIAKFVAFVALTVWSVLEVVSGVNYFRRVLGFIVLIGLTVSVVQAL